MRLRIVLFVILAIAILAVSVSYAAYIVSFSPDRLNPVPNQKMIHLDGESDHHTPPPIPTPVINDG
jgi:hypothetical protein